MLPSRNLSTSLHIAVLCLATCLGACGCTHQGSEPSASSAQAGQQGSAPSAPDPARQATENLLLADLTTVGWDALTDSPVVLLRTREEGRTLPIWIGLAEAQAIGRALLGLSTPRPMTHDLMADLLRNLDARLEEVQVTELRQGTYYGLLKVRTEQGDEPRWIDTRPSDALALALRTGATIRVASNLLEGAPDVRLLGPERFEQVVRTAGLTVVAITEELRQQHSIPEAQQGLVVVAAIGPAKKAGLLAGDLIIQAGGQTVAAPVDLLSALHRVPEGAGLPLVVWRQGEELKITLPLDDPWPELPTPPRPGDAVA